MSSPLLLMTDDADAVDDVERVAPPPSLARAQRTAAASEMRIVRDEGEEEEDGVLQALREVIVWPQKYASIVRSEKRGAEAGEGGEERRSGVVGFRWPHGVLLHGPAGVGKTSAVRRVAREVHRHRGDEDEDDDTGSQRIGAEVFEVPPEALGGEFVGDSERRLRETFATARAAARKAVAEWEAAGAPSSVGPAPSILLLENVDALCPPRNSAMQHETRVVAQMLLLLDSLNADEGDDEDDDGSEDDENGKQQEQQQQQEEKNEEDQQRYDANGHTGSSYNGGGNHDEAGKTHEPRTGAARVVVIATTEKPNAIDDALRRPGRLEREVAFPMPNVARRTAILTRLTHAMPLRDDGIDVRGIAASCTGYTAADLAALAREAFISALKRSTAEDRRATTSTTVSEDSGADRASLSPNSSLEVCASDFERARERVPPSVSRSSASELRQMRWEEVGGMDEAKKLLQQSLLWPLKHAPSFARLGIRPPRGILLYGPPGCAKTSLALCGATEAAVPFFHLDCASLYSMWVGEGEARLRETFRQARLAAPSIVFLDEIDAALPRRNFGGGGGGGGADGGADHGNAGMRLLTTLLTEIDGLDSGRVEGVVLLAATNRPWDIDPALMRPGRIDVHCFVPPPDEKGRRDILHVATKAMPVDDASDLLCEVSRRTDLYTGAELVAVCREAAMHAMRRGADAITMHDFEHALHESAPSTTKAAIDEFLHFGARA